MLRNPEFDLIHGEVVMGLSLLGDQRAVEPLLVLVAEGNLAGAAIHALKTLAPEHLAEPLLKIIRERDCFNLYVAAMTLAEMRDDRAVPLLVDLMRDKSPRNSVECECVSRCIAGFGRAGFDALVSCLAAADPVIRRRAVDGLYCTNRPEARDAVTPLLEDADPSVRERVKLALDVLPPPRGSTKNRP
jgi:hypothetical protein